MRPHQGLLRLSPGRRGSATCSVGGHVLDARLGAAVFGKSGVCHPDAAKVLFYWVCDASSPLSILAGLVNVALTVDGLGAGLHRGGHASSPNAMAIALPIIAVHVVGLPLGHVRPGADCGDRSRFAPHRKCANGCERKEHPALAAPWSAAPTRHSVKPRSWPRRGRQSGAAAQRIRPARLQCRCAAGRPSRRRAEGFRAAFERSGASGQSAARSVRVHADRYRS